MMDANDVGLGIKRRHEDDVAAGTGDEDDGSDNENEHQTSKSRGTVTVQIFIKSKGVILPEAIVMMAKQGPNLLYCCHLQKPTR